jgi:hypothetical protein
MAVGRDERCAMSGALRALFYIGAVLTTTALNPCVSLQAPLRARRYAVRECAEGVSPVYD